MTKTLTSNQWTPTANASMNKNIIFKLSLFNQFQFSTLYRFHSNTHYTHKHARSYFPFVFLMIDFLIGFSCNTIPTHCVYSLGVYYALRMTVRMSSILSQSRSIFHLFAESALEQDLFQIRSNFHLV